MSSRSQPLPAPARRRPWRFLFLGLAAALLLALAAFGYVQATALTTAQLAARLRAAGATVAVGGDAQPASLIASWVLRALGDRVAGSAHLPFAP